MHIIVFTVYNWGIHYGLTWNLQIMLRINVKEQNIQECDGSSALTNGVHILLVYTLQPFYNTVRYNTILDITRYKDGSEKNV